MNGVYSIFIFIAAYLNTAEYNVIIVDWRLAANMGDAAAFSFVPIIAEGVTEFLELLTTGETPAVATAKLHLVGFGLGAHLAGFASRNLPEKAQRITGMAAMFSIRLQCNFIPEQ